MITYVFTPRKLVSKREYWAAKDGPSVIFHEPCGQFSMSEWNNYFGSKTLCPLNWIACSNV